MKHKTLYFGGHIITCNLRDEIAEAMLIHDDKILYVGDYETAHCLVDADTEILHIGGRAIIPTFTDSHCDIFNENLSSQNYEKQLEAAFISGISRGITTFGEEGRGGEKGIFYAQKYLNENPFAMRIVSQINDSPNTVKGALATCFSACGICTGFGNSHHKIGHYQMTIEAPKNEEFSLGTGFALFLKHLLEHGIAAEFKPKNKAEAKYALWCLFYLENATHFCERCKIQLHFGVDEEILYLISKTKVQVIIPCNAIVKLDSEAERIFQNIRYYQEKSIPFCFSNYSNLMSPISPFALLSAVLSLHDSKNHSEQYVNDVKAILRAMTLHAAMSVMQDEICGSLEWGKAADFILLSASPFAISPSQIQGITPLRVVCNGRVIYDKVDTLSPIPSVYVSTTH